MLKKKGEMVVFRKILLFFFLFQSSMAFSSALGVSPAIISLDFQPNFEQTFDYRVFGTKPNTDYLVYLQGDLAEYASLNKEKLKGNDNFRLFLSLPASFEIPGKHILYVGVKELVDPELAIGGTIGTAIEIVVVINVFVPYPGKYVEMSFSSGDANVGELVKFRMDLINRGEESVVIFPRIEIFSNQTSEKTETLLLEERDMESMQKLSLQKSLDTSSYNPGRYKGVAIVEYGGKSPATAESPFRIGNLSIEIKNYTDKVLIDGKIQKFDIEIESGWNDRIDGVFADVVFFNQTSELLSIKTTSTNLNPWESKIITGYIDTLNIQKGIYNATITLAYYGKDVGRTSTKTVQVEFIEKTEYLVIVLITLGAVVLIVLVAVIWFFVKRKKSRRK